MTSIKRKCRTCIHCDVNNLICRPGSKDCHSEYALDIHDLDTAEPCDFYEESEGNIMSQLIGGYNNNESDHIDNLDHSSLYPSMNHKIDLMDPDKDRKELREAIRSMLEEEGV